MACVIAHAYLQEYVSLENVLTSHILSVCVVPVFHAKIWHSSTAYARLGAQLAENRYWKHELHQIVATSGNSVLLIGTYRNKVQRNFRCFFSMADCKKGIQKRRRNDKEKNQATKLSMSIKEKVKQKPHQHKTAQVKSKKNIFNPTVVTHTHTLILTNLIWLKGVNK